MADKDDKAKKPEPIELAASYETPGILYGLCHDSEAGTLYGAGADWSVFRVDLKVKEPKAEKAWTNHENYVSSLAWQDGVVISAGYDRRLVWTTAADGKTVQTVEDAHDAWIRDLVMSPDGSRLVSCGDDMVVRVRDAATGKPINSLKGHAKKTPQGFATALYSVAVSPDSKTIASADRIGDICLWSAESGELVRRLKAPEFYTYDSVKRSRSIGGIRRVCFSLDGTQLAVSGIGAVTNVDGFVGPARIEVWNWQSGKRLFASEENHKAVLNDIVFHPSKPILLAAGGGDSGGLLGAWDSRTGKLLHKAKPKGHIQRLRLDSTGETLYTSGHGGLQVWKMQDLKAAAKKS